MPEHAKYPTVEPNNRHSLPDEPLDELLLALEARGDSVALRVRTSVGDAQIKIDRGRLSLAVFGAKLGQDALKSLLSHREGNYSLSPVAPEEGPFEDLPVLGEVIRAQERLATRLGPSSTRRQLRLRAPLTRSELKLPNGLAPAELRALAAIDGRATPLGIVRSSKDSAAETLSALRNLLAMGLAKEGAAISVSPTLTMGSHQKSDRPSSVPPAQPSSYPPENSSDGVEFGSDPNVVHRASPQTRAVTTSATSTPSATSNLKSQEDANWELAPSEHRVMTKKPVGQLSRAPIERQKPRFTGYSSVPPQTLAADQVHLPQSLRTQHADRAQIPATNSARDNTRADESHTLTVDRDGASQRTPDTSMELEPRLATSPYGSARPLVRKDTPTALSVAVIRPSKTFAQQNYQLRDSEIPVPSSRLDEATLHQLDELNHALKSSRKPRMRGMDWRDLAETSVDSRPSSEPGPPSSLGLGLNLGELPPPGSVPHPRDLPGSDNQKEGQLPRVGRYEVLARIKRGGMGSVYMCRLSGTGGFRRLFAMKVLHGHLAEQNDSLGAFFHEARVLGELHHPNIVGIADVGTPQEPYIVMDYVEGGSLAELYRATASGRDPSLVVAIVTDALNGLHYAHTARDENGQPVELVHCDVTPHNLLIGIDGTCRVTDFGIARTKMELGDPTIIQGKPGYLAPEQLRQATVDHRADVFSMGVVLYAGLTGVEPFRGRDADESSRLILKGDVRPPSEVGFRPPPALDWVCMKALASDPEARFSSAEEMALQLRRIADREEIVSAATDVGLWVRASLGPTLAARRAASLRGTGNTEPPPAVSVFPSRIPPAIRSTRESSNPPPSAAETTGPLLAPSNPPFGDDTEIMKGGAELDSERTPLSATSRYALFAVVAISLASAFWAFTHPSKFVSFFNMASSAQTGMGKASTNILSPPPAEEPPQKTDTIDASDEDNGQDKIKLPPIPTSGGK